MTFSIDDVRSDVKYHCVIDVILRFYEHHSKPTYVARSPRCGRRLFRLN